MGMADVEERKRGREGVREGKRGQQMLAETQAKSKRMFNWAIWKFSTVFITNKIPHSTWEYKNILRS